MIKSLEANALSKKIEEACGTLDLENESALSDGELKSMLFEMKTYINNYQNVIRKNKDVFEQYELLDNVFPNLQDDIYQTVQKMNEIESGLENWEEIKNMDSISF